MLFLMHLFLIQDWISAKIVSLLSINGGGDWRYHDSISCSSSRLYFFLLLLTLYYTSGTFAFVCIKEWGYFFFLLPLIHIVKGEEGMIMQKGTLLTSLFFWQSQQEWIKVSVAEIEQYMWTLVYTNAWWKYGVLGLMFGVNSLRKRKVGNYIIKCLLLFGERAKVLFNN